ncbi:hypothetical protein RJ639_033685 [Escallonia herrerae]|uniref:Uncharacterized protein n=1 Tax=Escallonia herrerae TaxID=1293975 RepID=A0AA88WWW3_9ASTE|nr:hypothetical protein RJ639_033685 [Escallonia herrerae]
MSSKLRSLVGDLISLPMPTIAAVFGHASAAGLILALSHDYVLMRKDKGFLYMSEMDIGFKVPAWFVALLRCKVGSPAALRDVVLRAEKLGAEAAAKKAIVDLACEGAAETVEEAVRLGKELVGRRWNGAGYGRNRETLLAEVVGAMRFDETVDIRRDCGECGWYPQGLL